MLVKRSDLAVAYGELNGLNRQTVVAALTNIFPGRTNEGFRSRGALVTDMLHLSRASDAQAALARTMSQHSYNNFNLLVADPVSAFVFSWAGTELVTFVLGPGVYQVNNIPFDGKGRTDAGVSNRLWLDVEEPSLAEHPLVCRHGDGYGTRCSHKLLIHKRGVEGSCVWHLEGHPCEGQFQQVLGGPERSAS